MARSPAESGSEWEDEQDPTLSTFVPRSKVLLTGAATFDSDAEDDGESSINLETLAKKASNPQKQVTYCSSANGAIVEFTPEQPWKSLSGLLPTDTWTTLLDDADKEELTKLLPVLGGWKDLSADEALQETVAMLLRGDNFHFGNPLQKIDQEITTGRHTREATLREQIKQAQDKVAFQRIKTKVMEGNRKELCRNHSTYSESLSSLPADDDSRRYHKRARGPSRQPFILKPTSPSNDPFLVTVTTDNSLFCAIRQALTLSISPMLLNDVLTYLQKHHQNALPSKHYFFAFLDASQYIEAALHFLSNPCGKQSEKSATKDASKVSTWEASYVEFNEQTGNFSWRTDKENSDVETRCLLVLEQVFRAPVAENTSVYGSKRLLVESMRKSTLRTLGAIQASILRAQDASFAAAEADSYECPATILQKSIVPSQPYSVDLASFHAQELERYAHPTQPFIYQLDAGKRVEVGSVLNAPRTSYDQDLLVKDAPEAVTVLNLVRDASARLPNGHGSRGDIQALLQTSQFIRPNVKNFVLNEALVFALNQLESVYMRQDDTTHRFVAFQDRISWRYISQYDRKNKAEGPTPERPALALSSILDDGPVPLSSNTATLTDAREIDDEKAQAGHSILSLKNLLH